MYAISAGLESLTINAEFGESGTIWKIASGGSVLFSRMFSAVGKSSASTRASPVIPDFKTTGMFDDDKVIDDTNAAR